MLRLPLKQVMVTQPFGVNYLDFYKKMGLAGHNGTDLRAKNGFNLYASHAGIATFVGEYSDGGKAIELTDTKEGIKTLYFHLEGFACKQKDKIKAGQLIGYCDNTGAMTTGSHLHWGIKFVNKKGETVNYDNGYRGAVDPMAYVTATYDGTPIKTSDADKSNAYHRYFRTDRNIALEVKYYAILARILKRIPKTEEVNAAIYGAWDRETLTNPAMYEIWGYLTKGEYMKGARPFVS